ncbi:unnamed protein product [Sphagnum troendelagicum]|uniref:Uncharacterized protein n=1 Tax=Sphagnum troendelagicum TaxID=128251 RepID=A0ABP0TYE2_9BRYO
MWHAHVGRERVEGQLSVGPPSLSSFFILLLRRVSKRCGSSRWGSSFYRETDSSGDAAASSGERRRREEGLKQQEEGETHLIICLPQSERTQASEKIYLQQPTLDCLSAQW